MAEIKLTEQQRQIDQLMKESKPIDKMTLAEFLEFQKALAKLQGVHNSTPVSQVLEAQARSMDQRQEQQLYASTWGGTAAVLITAIKFSNTELEREQRKALQQVLDHMYELMAKEEKRRRIRDSAFFRDLAAVLGESVAESVVQKLESAGTSTSGLQANKQALSQAAKDIAVILEKSAPQLGLSIKGEKLATELESEMRRSIAAVPKANPNLVLVRPEDSLAAQAHDKIFQLKTSEERLLEVQSLRGSLGAERFSAMIDAYDRKFGIPLVAHIAMASSSASTPQSEMVYEMRSVLSPEQQARLTQFGRAEFAQAIARLGKDAEQAADTIKTVNVELRETERYLVDALGSPSLKDLPEKEFRGKVLEELAKKYPGLKGKSWDEVALRLKEIAGEKDDAVQTRLLKDLLGRPGVDLAQAREDVTRLALHLQKTLVLDQKIEMLKRLTSQDDTGDRALIRKHYKLVYGEDAVRTGAELDLLTKQAGLHAAHLEQRLLDPNLSSEERARLIFERDSVDFALTKKLVAQSLEETPPNAQRARALLREFLGEGIASESRRGREHFDVAIALSEAVESAERLRNEWQALSADEIAEVKLERDRSTTTRSCIDGRPVDVPKLDLAKGFAELKNKEIYATPTPAGSKPPVRGKAQLDLVAQQREAALSTKWFTQILETGGALDKAIVPQVQVATAVKPTALAARLAKIEAASGQMDSANERFRSGISAVATTPTNDFLRADTQRALSYAASQSLLKSLGASSSAEAVKILSRELDPNRPPVVDKEVLQSLRAVVDPNSEIGRALHAVPASESDQQSEYAAIQSRLTGPDSARVSAFVAIQTASQSGHTPEGAPSDTWKSLLALTPEELNARLNDLVTQSRIARVEALMKKLSDEERDELLALFNVTTRQSVGQILIDSAANSSKREELLVTLATSRAVTSHDLERVFGGKVPGAPHERVAALQSLLQSDRSREIDSSVAREAARDVGYDLTVLGAAAQAAGSSDQLGIAAEAVARLRPLEARVNGKIAQVLATVDPAFAYRQGLSNRLRGEALQAATESIAVRGERLNFISDTVTAVEQLLRSTEPKFDAAFNRMRQANLTEEETILFRALYAAAATRPSQFDSGRKLTGNLSVDLTPEKSTAQDQRRIAALSKGGQEALLLADLETLKNAEGPKKEKLQVETLSNLKATKQYEAAKDKIEKAPLAPKATEYHTAVKKDDKLKSEMADISVKASNGDLKPTDVAKFAEGKSDKDLARVRHEDPEFEKKIRASDPKFFNDATVKVLSPSPAEREKALQEAMLKSLNDPILFGAWLNVSGSQEGRIAALRKLEDVVRMQPNAPRFVENGESIITQYVRHQKTDYREIDAYIINAMIVSAVTQKLPLSPETLGKLQALRDQAQARLQAVDTFTAPREEAVKRAREIRDTYQGAQVWAAGSPVLQANQLGVTDWLFMSKEEYKRIEKLRADEVKSLQERFPNLQGLGERQIEKGMGAKWFSGHTLKEQIRVTPQRIAAQEKLLAPMERALTDIQQTRELTRASFALMAKDTVNDVFRGLTPENAEAAMTLLRQRDAKVTYKVADQVEHEKWVRLVGTSKERMDRWDFYSDVGVLVAKAGVVVVAGVASGGWGAPLVAATLFNGAHKAMLYAQGESLSSAAKKFAIEGAIDVAFTGVSVAAARALSQVKVVIKGGQWGEKCGLKPAESVIKMSKEAQKQFKPGGEIVRRSDLPFIRSDKALSPLEKPLSEFFQNVLAQGGGEWPVDHVLVKLVSKNLPQGTWGIPGSEKNSQPLAKDPQELIDLAKKEPLVAQGQPGVGNPPKPVELPFFVVPEPPVKPAAEPATAVNSTVALNIPGNPEAHVALDLLTQRVEQTLLAKPDPDIQRELDNLKALLADAAVNEARLLEAARRIEDAVKAAAERDQNKPEWTPYPDLAKALDGFLNAANPWAALGQSMFTYEPSQPPPPPFNGPQPPVNPTNSVEPGGAGKPPASPGGRPGPALQVAMAPLGGMNGQGSGNSYTLSNQQTQGQSLAAGQIIPEPNAQGVSQPSQVGISLAQGAANAQPQAGLQPTPIIASQGAANGASNPVSLDLAMTSIARAEAQAALMQNPSAVPATVGQPNSELKDSQTQQASISGQTIASTQTQDAQLFASPKPETRATTTQQASDEEIHFVVALKENSAGRRRVGANLSEQAKQQSDTDVAGKGASEAKRVTVEEPTAAGQLAASKSARTSNGDGADVATREVAVLSKAEGARTEGRERSTSTDVRVDASREKVEIQPGQKTASVALSEAGAGQSSLHAHPIANSHIETIRSTLETTIQRGHAVAAAPAINHPHADKSEVALRAQPTIAPRSASADASAEPRQLTQVAQSLRSAPERILFEPAPHSALEMTSTPTHESIESPESSTAPRKQRRRSSAAQDARMREVILKQLMTQHQNKLQREKLLKALIDLGISESEYRALVSRLGEMDAQRLAQEQANRQKFAEPIVVAQAQPLLKSDAPIPNPTAAMAPKTTSTPTPKTSRGSIYRQLKNQTSPCGKQPE